MKRRKRKGRWLMALGLLCIACALGLLAYNLNTERKSDQAAQDVLVQLNQQIAHTPMAEAEATTALIIADQDGTEIDWPLQESGLPMPWPVDQDGRPQPSLTDAFDSVYIWQYEQNRPIREHPKGEGVTSVSLEAMTAAPTLFATVLPADSFPGDGAPADTPLATASSAATSLPTDILHAEDPSIETPAPSANSAPNEDADLIPEGIVTASTNATPEPADSENVSVPNALGNGVNTPLPEPDETGNAHDLLQMTSVTDDRTYGWTTDPAGNLLPYASDGQGQVIPWMTDAQGNVLKLDVLSQMWELLLEQLNMKWRELLDKPAFILNPDMEMPVTELDGHEYIGILDIPSQELSLPVMSEWSYAKLRIAPCRYTGSVYTGDVILAGHNSNGHFSPIKKLVIGDEVRFTDADGNVFIYSVIGVDVIGENDVRSLLAGSEEWDLSMFTCSHNSRKRTTVRCKLETYIAVEDAAKE